MKKSTTIAISFLIIAAGIGGYFGIRSYVKYHKAIRLTYNEAFQLVDFLKTEFPDQVADYNSKLQAKYNPQAPLPASGAK